MKLSLLKSPVVAALVIAGLAAGTALVAGYVDQPDQAQKVSAGSKCNDCPRQGADTCCQVTGVCAEAQACASQEAAGPCGAPCEEQATAACCPASGCCDGDVRSTCGTGACPHAK